MEDIVKSCLLGMVIGFAFSFANLRSPSPDSWVGILGIAGIFIGWNIGEYIK